MKKETKELLISKYKESPKGWSRWIRAKVNADMMTELYEEYPTPTTLSEKMYWLANDLTAYPVCPVCGKTITTFINQTHGYNKFCSCTCAQLSPDTQAKLKQTNLNRYGCANPMQAKEVQDKVKATCLERYGVENSYQSDVIKEKIKQTNLERYGVENVQQNTAVKQKTKQTMIEKYGVACGFLTAAPYAVSKGEQEVADYIKTIYKGIILLSDRTTIWPYELDIYLPELMLGIEYDGDYWHSLPDMVDRDHKKERRCANKGITLIRIKESAWLKDTDHIKGQLLQLVNNNERHQNK